MGLGDGVVQEIRVVAGVDVLGHFCHWEVKKTAFIPWMIRLCHERKTRFGQVGEKKGISRVWA